MGAAIAVSLGAGGIGISHATTSSGEMPIYLPIEPCRLADTRPAFNVGPRATPLGAAETYDITGWGSVGNCALPSDTAGLALTVTAIDPSAPTFLTLFPDGTTLPLASHLNPTPGQPPTPNAVNVDLSAAGNFSIYNLAGNVHVAIDVVGIYDDHVHTGADIVDGSLTGTDIEDESVTGTDIDDNTVTSADTQNEPGVSWTDKVTTTPAFGGTDIVASSVLIRPPSDGFVTVQASLDWFSPTTGAQIRCQITDGTDTLNLANSVARDTSPSASDTAQALSLTQTFAVDRYTGLALSGQPFNLVCDSSAGNSRIGDIHMTATFIASSYAPFTIVLPIGASDRLDEGASAGS